MTASDSRILLLFVDGLGIGSSDPGINPLARTRYSSIESLVRGSLTLETPHHVSDRALYMSIDANLDVAGLPQSGTGQATLFTGVNCAQLAGRHYGPFPHSSSKPVIREGNLFADAWRITGSAPVFANAYPDRFFRYIERTNRWTVTTLCCSEAGIRLKTGEDLRAGHAISADITGRKWPEADSDHDIITPQQAGRRLTRIADDTCLTVFEYFETDKAGHSFDVERAEEVLVRLDGLIEGILDSIHPEQTLVVTSDHGNLEDMSTKTHTRNPVPLLVLGPAANHFRDVDGLVSVKPAILNALSRVPPTEEPETRSSG